MAAHQVVPEVVPEPAEAPNVSPPRLIYLKNQLAALALPHVRPHRKDDRNPVAVVSSVLVLDAVVAILPYDLALQAVALAAGGAGLAETRLRVLEQEVALGREALLQHSRASGVEGVLEKGFYIVWKQKGLYFLLGKVSRNVLEAVDGVDFLLRKVEPAIAKLVEGMSAGEAGEFGGHLSIEVVEANQALLVAVLRRNVERLFRLETCLSNRMLFLLS